MLDNFKENEMEMLLLERCPYCGADKVYWTGEHDEIDHEIIYR